MGLWDIEGLKLKISGEMVTQGQSFLREEVLPVVAAEGDDDGLGFVILHPGDLGISTSVHWWILGSVLCQQIHRQLYGAAEPMDMKTRPAIVCVWEPALINAEQEIWRRTMMTDSPGPAAYLEARADIAAA